jgi:integrase
VHAKLLSELESRTFQSVNPDSQQTLKHTCITWLLQNRVPIWEVAGFVGTSEKVIRDTYGHHSPDHLNAARTGFSGRSLGKGK